MSTRVEVCIIGAGPGGLLLAHLLAHYGIDAVVLERCTRTQVLERVRAGIIDQNTMDVLKQLGFAEELKRAAVVHHGFELVFERERHRIDITELTRGRSVAVFPQQEVVRCLLERREQQALPVLFEAEDVTIRELGGRPSISFRRNGVDSSIEADFVVGCDGFHGVSRQTIPQGQRTERRKDYPFAWLGILCQAPRVADELIYAAHSRGFALISTRSPTVQRMYLQCDTDSSVEAWTDERIWEELERRTESRRSIGLVRGPIVSKEIFRMRSFVCETMRYESLFLAGDAAHIVPPSAAKGLNLAVLDVCLLARALVHRYKSGQSILLDQYQVEALKRYWRGEEFSNFSTGLFHCYPGADDFDQAQRSSALRYLVSSRAAATSFAENYAGIPEEVCRRCAEFG